MAASQISTQRDDNLCIFMPKEIKKEPCPDTLCYWARFHVICGLLHAACIVRNFHCNYCNHVAVYDVVKDIGLQQQMRGK